jgi:hypothetical protein
MKILYVKILNMKILYVKILNMKIMYMKTNKLFYHISLSSS